MLSRTANISVCLIHMQPSQSNNYILSILYLLPDIMKPFTKTGSSHILKFFITFKLLLRILAGLVAAKRVCISLLC